MKKIFNVKDYLLEVLDGVEGIPSFELARMVGKRHDHVLVAIRNEVNIYKKFKPDIDKDIIPYWYTGKNNQHSKAYFLIRSKNTKNGERRIEKKQKELPPMMIDSVTVLTKEYVLINRWRCHLFFYYIG